MKKHKKLKIILLITIIALPLLCGFVWVRDSLVCRVTYELNEGVNSPLNQKSYLKSDGIIYLEDAEKEAHDFIGWYTSPDFAEESRVTQIDASNGGKITLYAKFERVLYFSSSSVITGLTEYGKTKSEIKIPDSCTEIGAFAFKGASNLERLVADNAKNLKSIKMGAFEDCTSLTEISLPASLETIEGRAFRYSQLEKILFQEGSLFEVENGNLVNTKNKTLAIGGTSGVVPEGIETIGAYAYSMNKEVKQIMIPDSVETVGSHAFANCHNLTKIDFSENDSLQVVGEYAFAYCYKLEELSLPDSVETIGNGAFSSLKKLTSFKIPSCANLKTIGYSMFYGLESLEEVVIPEGVESIEADAFANCKGLKSVIIPASVKKIDGDAFRDCDNLESVEYLGSGDLRMKPHCMAYKDVDDSLAYNAQEFARILKGNDLPVSFGLNAYTRFYLYW